MKKSNAWLMLVSSVSGDNKTARMRIWRALKASGAGTLRDGVYVLPNSPAARTLFEEQARQAIAARGGAQVLAVDAEDAAQQNVFVALFDRSADYGELFDRLEKTRAAAARVSEIELRRRIAVLRRDVSALVAIDFFPGAPRRQVEQAASQSLWNMGHAVGHDHPGRTQQFNHVGRDAYAGIFDELKSFAQDAFDQRLIEEFEFRPHAGSTTTSCVFCCINWRARATALIASLA